jgi:hypothetical protein
MVASSASVEAISRLGCGSEERPSASLEEERLGFWEQSEESEARRRHRRASGMEARVRELEEGDRLAGHIYPPPNG